MAHILPSHNDEWDEARETIDGFRTQALSFYPGHYTSNYNYPIRYEGPSRESFEEMPSVLSRQDAIGLFRDSVEKARFGIQQSLAGSERVGEAVKLKLTVDLSHQSIEEMPDEIIEILKRDVESLKLAHNQIWHIPYRFAECTPLKYLNLRGNRFKEFPKAVYKLPQLEILDLSRNKLSRVPEEIENMKALRVLSLLNNNIGDLPPCLGLLDALRVLKIAGNPLVPTLLRILDGSDGSSSPPLTALADNEKESLVTRKIKKYLKAEAVKESGEESSSDGPLDTPRPMKRNLSIRFPVKPNTSGSESASDARSAGFQRPPIPTRSHYRVASGQNDSLQAAALRRPGIAPLSIANERNRSNSEGVLQATQNTRSKRMGMVTRKNADLGVLDEARANRNSLHYRGQSHGSALRDKQGNGVRHPGSLLASPHDSERQRGTFVRRLSSLPEHKRESQAPDSIIEGAKGVLYSLHQVHQHISSLIYVVKDGTSKRSSLERVYHNATTHLEHLDQELHGFDNAAQDNMEEKARLSSSVSYACHACIVAYRQVGNLLLRNVSQLIADGDQRYIRTLVLLLYGSLVEARNACVSLGIKFESKAAQPVSIPRITTIHEEGQKRRDRSLTPTRERPNPERRRRNGNAPGNAPGNLNLFNSVASAQSSVPLYINGRSRSNSRTTGLNGSTVSSIANTPRSGESFNVPGTPMVRSRSNSAMAVHPVSTNRPPVAEDPEKEALFEKIFLALNSSVESSLGALPSVQNVFRQCSTVAESTDTPMKIRDLWPELLRRCRYCLELSETLKIRLSTIKLHEPSTIRSSKEFWDLCTSFIHAVVDLLTEIRIAKRDELIPVELLHKLRPMYVFAREAAFDMKASPWGRKNSNSHTTPELTPSSHANASGNGTYRHHQRALESTGSNASPLHLPSIPATPLSAALGPAAQATVPSTPSGGGGGGGLDRSFQGDVFQRADSLLQQTMVYRR